MSEAMELGSSFLLAGLSRQLRLRPDESALKAYHEGEWVDFSWAALAHATREVASRLQEAGVGGGDRVAIWSANRWEWCVVDLATQWLGAVSVPFHGDASLRQVIELATHSGSVVLFSASRTQAELLHEAGTVGELREVWAFEDGLVAGCPWEASGVDSEALADEVDEVLSGRDPDDWTTLLYTSGTTGEPKGVMLSQRNLVANVTAKLAVLSLGPEDVRVVYLPLSHVFARTCDWYTGIAVGCQTILGRGPGFIWEELNQFQPTYLNSVPYFYEKCWRLAQQQGKLDVPGFLAGLLGGRMRLCNCGGAPLRPEVWNWFERQGVMLVTGYGLTESAPVLTSSSPAARRLGAVGQAVPGVEVVVAQDGEVLARGENVMLGYYRNPEATRSVLREGWLHTGDLGHFDEDGYLFLHGRKKELIVTNAGKKIVPHEIENRLLDEPVIEQCVVVGEGRKYLAALVRPVSSLLERGEVELVTAIGRAIAAGQQELSRYECVVRFALLPEPLTVDAGLLTLKGTVRRERFGECYRELIDQVYEGVVGYEVSGVA